MKKPFKLLDFSLSRASSLYSLWPLVPTGVVAAITISLGSTAEYIASLGPFGWWAIGIGFGAATYVTIAACGWAIEATREKRVRREIAEKLASVSSLNPLEERFFKKRLSLHDFADPFGHPLRQRVFEQCELIGPSTIVIQCDYAHNEHYHVEFAKIDDDKLHEIPNKIILRGGAIRNCKIANVLFLVPKSAVSKFEQGFDRIPWIN